MNNMVNLYFRKTCRSIVSLMAYQVALTVKGGGGALSDSQSLRLINQVALITD